MTNLVWIGDNFYMQSGSIMSSIYTAEGGQRYDWGFVQRDLREGKEVHIRPANTEEKLAAYEQLAEIQNR
jgi:hypothetical protein